MKKLKYVLFIPVTLAAIVLINLAFMNLLNWTVDKTLQWYFDLNTIFFVLLVPFFWGTIWGVFKLAALGMAALLIPVSPDKKFSLYTLGIFSLINCLTLIVYFWLREANYSWSEILMSLIISMFIVDFSASIVLVFSKKGINAIEE
ncbi:MAG: hypothetical protein WC780_04985 [Lentimicrobiaceae bacterium]|jgi:hypothetical protein